MTQRFVNYHEAAFYARELATWTNLDVAIRGVKEFGKDGFNVSFAARTDSDYALAEIIKPREPQGLETQKGDGLPMRRFGH